MQTKIGEYALIVNDNNQCLLLRLENGSWHFPGGRLEEGEQAVAGLLREVREETGLEIEQVQPIHTVIFTVENKYGVFFKARVCGEVTVVLSDEHLEYRWCDLAALEEIELWQPFYKDLIVSVITE